MKHYVANTSEFRLIHNNSSSAAEITINLSITGPKITLSNQAHISGVYDSTNGSKNPGMPYCEIDEKKPTITDEMLSISGDTQNRMTLNLKTKLKQL